MHYVMERGARHRARRAVPCQAMSYQAMPCHALLMPWRAMTQHAMPCQAVKTVTPATSTSAQHQHGLPSAAPPRTTHWQQIAPAALRSVANRRNGVGAVQHGLPRAAPLRTNHKQQTTPAALRSAAMASARSSMACTASSPSLLLGMGITTTCGAFRERRRLVRAWGDCGMPPCCGCKPAAGCKVVKPPLG